MTANPPPDWEERLHAAAAEFTTAMAHVGDIFTTQAAIAWTYRGDIEQARQTLAGLTPAALQQVSLAGAALSAIADELLTTKQAP